MQWTDLVNLAWTTIRSNKLRTGITVAIIALGIMALIGIITAIQAMNQSLRESFSTMGANSFNIRYKERNFFMGGGNRRSVEKTSKGAQKKVRSSSEGRPITYHEARAFKEMFNFPGVVSISLRGGFSETVQYITEGNTSKTNPNISVQGGDENYLELNGYKFTAGRNLSRLDVESGRNVVVIGSGVVDKCFGGNALKAIEKTVKIGGLPYLVIGVLEPKGASAFLNLDNIVVTSYNNVRKLPGAGNTFSMGIMVADQALLEEAIGQSIGLFRNIRKLDVLEEDNFAIDKSDALAEQFIKLLGGISGAAAAIGLITLIGAAIGLMNIMLVAVTERTKEIGLSKAIGATGQNIRRQFLYESIIISLLGALFGILAGVVIGNLFSLLLKTSFVIPWIWIGSGVIICFLTGLLAGLYPASKASKLDPIVALRYE
jgi:putative ABC transport system permease protein